MWAAWRQKSSSAPVIRWWCSIILAKHKPEAVMHFAARSLVGESMQKPFLYLGDNVVDSLNLLRATVEHGVKRFILSSTANLFDNPAKIPIDELAQIIPG